MSLGERIGAHRKRMGISQEELGHRMGVSRQAVSKWETGRAVPDMENLLALARLFGVPVSELADTPAENPETEAFSETAEVSEKKKTRRLSRFWVILTLVGLMALLLLAGISLLLLGWNSAEISDQPVEFQVPVEELGPPEILPDNRSNPPESDEDPALTEPNQKSTPPESDTESTSEPDRDSSLLSDAEIVYRAFNQLAAADNLTAEERYAYRRDLFAYLPSMNWTEFGLLGTTEESDCIFALMDFLASQEDYSESELYRLQSASIAKGIDGAYAEYYAGVLSKALLRNPAAFVRQLAYDDGSGEPWPYHALSAAAYDLTYFPEKTAEVEKALESALSDGSFTEEQSGWCRLLLLYLKETEDGDQSSLPRTPEEMQD